MGAGQGERSYGQPVWKNTAAWCMAWLRKERMVSFGRGSGLIGVCRTKAGQGPQAHAHAGAAQASRWLRATLEYVCACFRVPLIDSRPSALLLDGCPAYSCVLCVLCCDQLCAGVTARIATEVCATTGPPSQALQPCLRQHLPQSRRRARTSSRSSTYATCMTVRRAGLC
jgi:hypothetical protein